MGTLPKIKDKFSFNNFLNKQPHKNYECIPDAIAIFATLVLSYRHIITSLQKSTLLVRHKSVNY